MDRRPRRSGYLFSEAGLVLLMGMLVIGCAGKDKPASKTQALSSHDLKTHEEKWANGQVRVRYTYYLDEAGNRVYHGKDSAWAQDGHKHREQEYRNGKRHGSLVAWYPDGQKTREGRWADNKKTGVWTGWHQTGDKAWACTYKNGKIVGKKTYWLQDKVYLEETHDDNGQIAEVVRWHLGGNGLKAVHGHFAGGEKNGQWIYWDKDGEVEAEGQWRNGKPWHGVCAIPVAGDAGSWAGITEFVRYNKGRPVKQE